MGFGRFLVILSFLLASRLLAAEPLQTFSGCIYVPTEWSDGDSFRVRFPDGEERTVRLYGADCVEWHVRDDSDARRLRAQRRYFGIAGGETEESVATAKAFGERAAEFTAKKLARPFRVVTAFADGRGDERFSRIYAFVITAEGKDLAAELVEAGLARAFGITREAPGPLTAAEYRDRLRDLELVAASRGKGIWAKTDWSQLADERQQQRADEAEIAGTLSPGLPAGGVNPNTASREELMRLPGIGEALALRIIEGRKAGSYRDVEDLRRVRGLRASTLDSLRESLRFTGAGSTPESSSN